MVYSKDSIEEKEFPKSEQLPIEGENKGTLILDAACAPQQIAYPQDANLLNEAREKLEGMIDTICYEYNYYKPEILLLF